MRDAAQPASRRRSVRLRRRLKHDSLELGQCVAAQAKHGLESFAPQFTRVQKTAQFVERGTLVLEDIVSARLQQDQVAWAAASVGEPHEALALCGVETLGGDDNALVGPHPSEHRRFKQLVCLRFNLVRAHSAGQQLMDLGQRQNRAALLDHPVSYRRRPGCRGADD